MLILVPHLLLIKPQKGAKFTKNEMNIQQYQRVTIIANLELDFLRDHHYSIPKYFAWQAGILRFYFHPDSGTNFPAPSEL